MTVFLVMGMDKTTNKIAVFDIYDNKDSCMHRISKRRIDTTHIYWMEIYDVKESNKYDEEIL